MSDLNNLYPFLSGQRQDPARLDVALLCSIEDKARESREMNARFFAEQVAEIAKMRLRCGALGQGGGAPFGDKVSSEHGARNVTDGLASSTGMHQLPAIAILYICDHRNDKFIPHSLANRDGQGARPLD